MDRLFFRIACLYGLLGVALGAFGAHALKTRLSPEMLAVFETGVRYQLLHVPALLAAAWASTRWPGRAASAAGWCFVLGVLLFSGSLYVLTLSGVRGLGMVTPLGGVLMMAGWASLGLAPRRAGRAMV